MEKPWAAGEKPVFCSGPESGGKSRQRVANFAAKGSTVEKASTRIIANP